MVVKLGAVTASQLKRLQSFVMKYLRIILSVSVQDKVRNTEIRAKAGMETVKSMIRRRRLRWLEHLVRMDHLRVPHQLMVCHPEGGKRASGGQKLRWNSVVMQDLKTSSHPIILACSSPQTP